MFIRKVATVAASVFLMSSVAACGGEDEPVDEGQEQGAEGEGSVAEGGLVTDPVPLLDAARGEVSGLTDCDGEMTVDLGGYGRAACIVPQEFMAVGVESNILQVVVYSDEEHREEFTTSGVLYGGPGYLATAPSQELLDLVTPAMDEAAAEQAG